MSNNTVRFLFTIFLTQNWKLFIIIIIIIIIVIIWLVIVLTLYQNI